MQSVFGDADAPIVVELAQNQIYKAFREVGRVMRTVALLRFLADSGLRARVTAAPTRPRPTTGSPPGPRFGNQGVIAENDPAEQESRSNGTRCCAT
jgi:TnpA family transposase